MNRSSSKLRCNNALLLAVTSRVRVLDFRGCQQQGDELAAKQMVIRPDRTADRHLEQRRGESVLAYLTQGRIDGPTTALSFEQGPKTLHRSVVKTRGLELLQ